MTAEKKCIWIDPNLHKKLKMLAVEKESTIKKELIKIIKKELKVISDEPDDNKS